VAGVGGETADINSVVASRGAATRNFAAGDRHGRLAAVWRRAVDVMAAALMLRHGNIGDGAANVSA